MSLTAQTASLWQDGISIDSLPLTFRDAVVVTRALGIDHLWIDCLCILQDSRDDWASESGRMADIYSNAVITIAADQSADSHGGIFAERSKMEADVLPIKSYPFASHSTDHSRLLRTGLHSRGWTYQERLLSRRVLHFTPSEMAWECTKEIHGPLFDEAGGDTTSLVQLHWSLIVFEFTARALTVETDRLSALAGIADLLCRCTAQQYYFGVLSAHAVKGLLWRNQPNTRRKRPSKRLPAAFAPSWSFGSITGRVGFVPNPERFTLLRLTATVHAISRQLLSAANPYGSGTGTIDLEGCVVPVRVEDPRHATVKKGQYVLSVVDDASLKPNTENLPYDYPPGLPWGYFQPDVDDFEHEGSKRSDSFLLRELQMVKALRIIGWAFSLAAVDLASTQ
ncbi:hypothetical protein MFIFM68171_04899 [Madurella fahalii]|uniref:Heterokaryon incompatibility domain-containing protein n=1 Tax=Madurella fahalii TaxID=1157608 RepID=A0ABQ0GAE5_9PEZI